MILTNRQTADLVEECGMIAHYIPEKVSERDGIRIMSYGQAGAAYDYRLGYDVRVFRYESPAVRPPNKAHIHLEDGREYVYLPSRSYALATTVEAWKLPLDVMAVNYGKSSYARLGLLYSITPFDPGWEGTPTITIHNPTAATIKLYLGEGIATAVLHRLRQRVAPYRGKYQYQEEVVTPSK